MQNNFFIDALVLPSDSNLSQGHVTNVINDIDPNNEVFFQSIRFEHWICKPVSYGNRCVLSERHVTNDMNKIDSNVY